MLESTELFARFHRGSGWHARRLSFRKRSAIICFILCRFLDHLAVAIDQGGYNGPNGDLCCSAKAPQCKIQTVYEAAKQYFSVTQQAVFLANPDGR